MKRIFGILLLSSLLIGTMLFPVSISTAFAASPIDIDNAIDKGLAYLNSSQSVNGEWTFGFPAACTAMAVLAFENAPNSHYGWNLTDPYHNTVQKGLDWLFSQASVVPISSANSAGNPDTNGNGFGIGWYGDGQPVYETPMVLVAIISSSVPTNVTTSGPANVIGRTYHDVAQDVVDWIAWAQNSVPVLHQGEGGWRYRPKEPIYQDSDNSLSQWPVIGLIAADEAWNIKAPNWVGSELLKWIAADQDLDGNWSTNPVYGGFDYQPAGTYRGSWRGLFTPADTATGILEMAYCNISSTDPRMIAAEGYLNMDWNPNGYCPNGDDYGWNWNIGDLYDMYAVMKACRSANPKIQFIANYTGYPSIEWYNGTGEYADALIIHQHPDGSWNNWVPVAEGGYIATPLSTAWGALILEYQIIHNKGNLEVTVVDAITGNPIDPANVSIYGPDILWNLTGNDGKATFYNITVGSYTVDASKDGYFPNSTGPVDVHQDETTNCTIILQPMIIHDVAIKDVVPDLDWVYQGKLCHAGVNVTAANLGGAAENFTVTLYAFNATANPANITVGTQPVTNLSPNGTLVLRFVWNSSGAQACHWYNLTAVASTVPGETNTTNNVGFAPWLVKVRLLGDVNGDDKVDGKDVAEAAKAFGSYGPDFLYLGSPPSPRYNLQSDVNNDNKVDGKDLVLVCLNWGKACVLP